MKKFYLLLVSTLIISLTLSAKDVPVYTLIKNAKKIIVVQDFMLPNIDQASRIQQTYNTILSEKLPVSQEFSELNKFICDYLNTKYEVSTFETGPDSIYYRNEKMMGKDVKVFDQSKLNADLYVRIVYNVNYWGTGTEPEIIYDASINVVLSFYQPKDGKMPKKRGSMSIVSLSKKSICTLEKAPVDGSLLDVTYFIDNYNPNQYIDEVKLLIPKGIDKQCAKFKKKVK